MHGLSDKTGIVTGSGSGMGRATARRLSEEGVTVAINDIDDNSAKETVEIIREDGGKAIPAIADVTDFDDVGEMVDDVAEELDGIDILVNNAGWDRMGWFTQQENDIWDQIIDINYKGQLNCSWHVANRMKDDETEGSIVNIASDAARVGSSAEAVYSGAKGGVVAFTKTLARELARDNITCNVVSPGPTDTPLYHELEEESDLAKKIHKGIDNNIPLGRLGQPEDIASAVAFMASEESDYITGQVLSVSGGLSMVD